MDNYIKDKIQTIKDNNSFGVIIETGAGSPIYNELAQYPNTASRIVLFSESPNNWDYNKKKFQHEDNIRAISPEVCKNFTYKQGHLLYDKTVNFVLVNTIQISNEPNVQTHGWFGLTTENTRPVFYHFTITPFLPRTEYIEIIKQIGLDILASYNDYNKLDNGYIDQILDEDLKFKQYETLTAIVNGKLNASNNDNTGTVIKSDGTIARITDLLREVNKTNHKNLIIFKGSFNPVHAGHLEVINGINIELPESKIVLSISARNREIYKEVEVDNLINRIKSLNDSGYDVIIDNLGYFNDSYSLIVKNPDFKEVNLHYIMASDTISRFLNDEKIDNPKLIPQFLNKWKNVTFWWTHRGGHVHLAIEASLTNVKNFNSISIDISSTQIREKNAKK